MSIEHLEKFKHRPLSYSSLNSWQWDKDHGTDRWAKHYLEDIDECSPELEFGKKFAESIEDGTCQVKELMKSLQERKEYPFKCKFGDIELVGFADAINDINFRIINEVKTGAQEWDQKRVDSHSQLTMYALMNYIINKINPIETSFILFWVPTQRIELENGDFGGFDYKIEFKKPIEVKWFRTERTIKDIMAYGAYIQKTYKEILAFVEAY